VFHLILRKNTDYFSKNINRLIFIIEAQCVFFDIGTQFITLFRRILNLKFMRKKIAFGIHGILCRRLLFK
jgi:hypothetical protein